MCHLCGPKEVTVGLERPGHWRPRRYANTGSPPVLRGSWAHHAYYGSEESGDTRRSRRSLESISRSNEARCSDWSASQARARQPSQRPWSTWSGQQRATIASMGRSCPSTRVRAPAARASSQGADDLSGSLLIARSTAHRGQRRHATVTAFNIVPATHRSAPRSKSSCTRWASRRKGLSHALSPRALGRPAPARRYRPGAGRPTETADRRRADLDAGRLDPTHDHEPAARPAKTASGLSLIFITHDLAAARYVSDRIAIMYAGRLVEMGPAGEVLGEPRHPYTMLLRDAVPDPTQGNVARIQAEERGEPPDLTALPVGCAFAPRCAFAREECLVAFPSWRRASEGHEVRCVLVDEATP